VILNSIGLFFVYFALYVTLQLPNMKYMGIYGGFDSCSFILLIKIVNPFDTLYNVKINFVN